MVTWDQMPDYYVLSILPQGIINRSKVVNFCKELPPINWNNTLTHGLLRSLDQLKYFISTITMYIIKNYISFIAIKLEKVLTSERFFRVQTRKSSLKSSFCFSFFSFSIVLLGRLSKVCISIFQNSLTRKRVTKIEPISLDTLE